MARVWRYFLPLAIFLGLLYFLWRGLSLDPHVIPSPLINRPAPEFSLPQLDAPEKTFTASSMKGRVWILNVFGSWCVSCRYEHPSLNELAEKKLVPIVGLNWKDLRPDATAWLARFGNPYSLVVSDAEGRVAIDYGVSGAPETFIIDKNGVIRFKVPGPIDQRMLKEDIMPVIRELQK